jgi:hypothetical protein
MISVLAPAKGARTSNRAVAKHTAVVVEQEATRPRVAFDLMRSIPLHEVVAKLALERRRTHVDFVMLPFRRRARSAASSAGTMGSTS